jgi:glycosyltransferase involved in cell wall biosynthesis
LIIISNGFNKFFLAVAAAEMNRRSLLSSFVTGAYPKPYLVELCSRAGINRQTKVARLLNRREEIDDRLVLSMWTSEAVYTAGLSISRTPGMSAIGKWVEKIGFRLYGLAAVSTIKRAAENGAKIYHYRAGFGYKSVQTAKSAGLITLCDHSIVHPEVLAYLVANQGRMPEREDVCLVDPLWSDINKDIEQAEAVVVNSQFVKDTFMIRGWNPQLIHVVYLGVDDKFLKEIPPKKEKINNGTTFQLLFAGSFEKRKGAEVLLEALRLLENKKWELKIVGDISPEIKRRFHNDLMDVRISCLGYLSMRDLAAEMVKADGFVFPSLAEGSARVVFMALACGCYVITTPNSGSIVEDGVHGRLVPAGNAEALASAIRETMALPRERLREIGRNNAQNVRDQYRQSQYGDKLQELYQVLLKTKEKKPLQPHEMQSLT